MTQTAQMIPMEEFFELGREAVGAIEALYEEAVANVRAKVTKHGKLSNAAIEREQHAAHGLAWFATYVESLREPLAYAERMLAEGRYGETEDLLTRIGVGEYLAQIFGGIPMSQGEFVRLGDFGLSPEAVALKRSPAIESLIAAGNTAPIGRGWSISSITPRPRRPSAPRGLMRPWKRSERKFANMRKPKSFPTPMNGI